MSSDPRALNPGLFTVERRSAIDDRGIVRFTDMSGGYDESKAELYFGDPFTQPTFWDSQNINTYDMPGKCFLCSSWTRIGAAEGSDHQYLMVPFNVSIYRFPTANMDATLVQKATQATGAPTWAALGSVYPGATAIRSAVTWRGVVYVASGENFLRTMGTAESWSTLAAPGPVGAAVAGGVAVGIDDKLVVWWESNGLYTYDGTAWVKIYPLTAGVVSSDQFCDLLFMGPGSFQFLTRDNTGVTTWREYSVEAAGTVSASWLAEPGFKVWPQGGMAFQGSAWVVGRLGSHRNVGILYSKVKLTAPDPIAVLDTNLATASQLNLDWAWRALFSVGDIAWLGGSSRQDRNATLYHFEVDDDGEIINPGPVISGVGGPIYSIAMLPYAASGASDTERIFISVGSATYYKDADQTGTPVTDAEVGMLQLPDIDLGLEDHERLWAQLTAFLTEESLNGTIEFQYRLDPVDPSDNWTALGNSAVSAVDGFVNLPAPNDDAAMGQYGTRVRILQVRMVWTRPLSGTDRDILDVIAVRFAALYPLGQAR